MFWDDRDERAGVKLHDMDKLGFTYQVVIGERSMKENKYEFSKRKDKKKFLFNEEELINKIKE